MNKKDLERYELFLKTEIAIIDTVIFSHNRMLNGLKRTLFDISGKNVKEVFEELKKNHIENGDEIVSETYIEGNDWASLITSNSDMIRNTFIRKACKNPQIEEFVLKNKESFK